MSKWSVALLGYDKPNYILVDKKTGKGDQGHVEMPAEYNPQKHQLIDMTIDNERRAKPGDIIAFKPWGPPEQTWTKLEREHFLIVTIDGLTEEQMRALCEPYFDEFVEEMNEDTGERFIKPKKTKMKRRFCIDIDDLESLGIDIVKMKNKNVEYVPNIQDIDKYKCKDKLKNRKVDDTDGLNTFSWKVQE
jgi:hypothetical protein